MNGKVTDYKVPPNVEYSTHQQGSAFAVTLENVQPGAIVVISLSSRWDYGDQPFSEDAIVVFKGKASAIGWADFDSTFLFKDKGFLEWLRR